MVQEEKEKPGAASAAKPTAPIASPDDDTPVPPAMQSIQLELVTEIPKPAGSIDASRTTPQSEKGGTGYKQEAGY